MIAKFFFQTKKRNQLLKTVMNGALCFIFNVAHKGIAAGKEPNSEAGENTGPEGGLVI